MTRRQLGKAIGRIRRFQAEVKWLGISEGSAQLAEVLERDEREDWLDALSVEGFLSPAPIPGLNGLASKHLGELTEDERNHLSTLLRSRCKPVEYASDKGVAA